MRDRRPAVGIDATPIVSSHAMRGIGRHVERSLEAALEAAPDWAAGELGTLLVAGQAPPLPGASWRTRRSPVRPQDLDPIVAAVADRIAVRRRPPRYWHHTDPLIPLSPLPRRRTIVSVYDAIPLQEPAIWASIRPHRRFAYRRYLALARGSRGVIASLASSARDIALVLDIPADRIAVVPNHVRRLGSDAGSRRRDALEGLGRPYLFVGTLEPHKRPELAVDIIAELVRRGEPASLAIVGGRPTHRRTGLMRRATEQGVGDRIRFLDRLDDADLDDLYGGSTLLATSRVEGFGQPPVEAILAGGRVAAVPIAAYLETVGDLASFATGDTAEELADAAQRATAPGDAARATLADRFGVVAATDALRSAYERFGAG